MEWMRLLVVASSAKNKGTCIACINIDSKEFIRPVPHTCKEWPMDPLDISLLTLWEVPIIKKIDDKYQPENYIVNDISKWKFLDNYSVEKFKILYKEVKPKCYRLLFQRGYTKINEFQNPVSIDIIEVDDAVLKVVEDEEGKPRLHANFSYGGIEYSYKVTYKFPPEEWSRLKMKRIHLLEEKAFLTLTGAKFNDFFNVFISGIIPRPKV